MSVFCSGVLSFKILVLGFVDFIFVFWPGSFSRSLSSISPSGIACEGSEFQCSWGRRATGRA